MITSRSYGNRRAVYSLEVHTCIPGKKIATQVFSRKLPSQELAMLWLERSRKMLGENSVIVELRVWLNNTTLIAKAVHGSEDTRP